jgi:hypothetical protein
VNDRAPAQANTQAASLRLLRRWRDDIKARELFAAQITISAFNDARRRSR